MEFRLDSAFNHRSKAPALALALFVLCAVSDAVAAPQAYLIRGTWQQTGTPIGAKVGKAFESVWLYDPTAYNQTTNPTGALDVTAKAKADGALSFPGFESWYRLPSPSIGQPDVIPNAGPNGINYLDVDLADSNNADFPRSKTSSMGDPTDPALIKVYNDVPDYGNGDAVELIDHVDMTSIGLGTAKRWDIFVFNIGILSNRNLPADIDGDVFNTGGAPWGLGVEGNAAGVPSTSVDQLPFGDASRDGTVDGGDYTLWADNYLKHSGASLWKQGDFNIDGNVDGGDYTLWADNYLHTIPLSAAALALAVPEPTSIVLGLVGGVLVFVGFNKRRRH